MSDATDLQVFCGTNEDRVELMQPWSRGEWSYATDGRVMVRVPRRGEVLDIAFAPMNAAALFTESFPRETSWEVLPELPEITMKDCLWCDGLKSEEGPGCDECGGEGKMPNLTPCRFGERDLNLIYLHKLARLGRVELAVEFGLHDTPLAFRWEGGQGLLMPMRRRGDGEYPEGWPLVLTGGRDPA